MDQEDTETVGGQVEHNMVEQQPPGLSAFTLSEADLLNLQQGGVLVTGQTDGRQHLSQGDIDALASIQEELDRMSSGQPANIVSEEVVGGTESLGGLTGHMGQQVLVHEGENSFGGQNVRLPAEQQDMLGGMVVSSVGGVRMQEGRQVRVVKRPATGTLGQVFNKVRIGGGEVGQAVRIGGAEVGQHVRLVTSQVGGLGGHQVRLVNSGGHNLKTIAPNTEQGGVVSNISIVNQDGSLTSLPVGQQGIRIVNTAQMGAKLVPKIPQQQVRIIPSTPNPPPQTFKILNSDGSLSDISSSFLRPRADLRPIPTSLQSTSPRKRPVMSSLRSPAKLVTLRPANPEPPSNLGQIVRTADGRLISLQAAKKVVLPSSPLPSLSPAKIVIRDSPVQAGQRQVVRLPTEPHTTLQASSDKVQFVRVVNSSGKSQTVPLMSARPPAPTLSRQSLVPRQDSVQGIRSVVPGGGLVVEAEQGQAQAGGTGGVLAVEKPRMVTNIEPQGVRPRKPCNCTKSQCLKLYCDCFANGEFCHNCNCNNCLNNLQNEEDRQRSIKQCLDRNPNAFKPKIGKNSTEGERRHNKGCNCKRSGCLKNYCECYEAKIPCTISCKCIGCKNLDTDTGCKSHSQQSEVSGGPPISGQGGSGVGGPVGAPGQGLNLGERWFKPSTSLRSKLLQAPTPLDSGGPKQPFSFVTQEVVEATCQCLLAQAEEGEKKLQSESEIELSVLEEFGRCLVQIIDFAGKSKRPQS